MNRRFLLILALALSPRTNAHVLLAALLPTRDLAQQVQDLQSVPDGDEEVRRRVAQAKVVRDRISHFIVRQLETMPSISREELQHQLQSIVCTPSPEVPCTGPLYQANVFAEPWGPGAERRQVVVGYGLFLGTMSSPGSLVTLESYEWDKESNKARMTSRGGSELNGFSVGFQQLAWYPLDYQYWIILSGAPLGWSGRAYGGRAILYSVGADQVQPTWTSGSLPNLRVQTNELGWEASYADADRFYGDLPKPYVFDVYKFSYAARTFERVIRYRY